MSNSYAQTRAEYRAILDKKAELEKSFRKRGVPVPRPRHSQAYEIGARADLQSLPSYSKYGKA